MNEGMSYNFQVSCTFFPPFFIYIRSEVKSFSHFQLFATPWTVACQASPSIGFLRQEYWSGLPLPSLGESSWPRDWTRVSCIAGRLFTIWATREAPIISNSGNQKVWVKSNKRFWKEHSRIPPSEGGHFIQIVPLGARTITPGMGPLFRTFYFEINFFKLTLDSVHEKYFTV